VALQNHQLHRNFQGYCTRRTTGQVYAFGVSSITQLEKGYYQNTKDIALYIEQIRNGRLPVEKGLRIAADQQLVRAVIEQLMCNQQLDIPAFCSEKGIDFDRFVSLTHFDTTRLDSLLTDGLVTFNNNVLNITDTGSFFIRNIACLFDPAYKATAGFYSQSV